MTVARGDTIVWSNADFVPHTATARDAAWDSKAIDGSASWRTVARTVGRHEYYCAFHPTMKATVVVR
jgi:plastocyanin